MSKILWVCILGCLSAKAGSVSESFDTTARRESATLVWNTSLGRLHPTLSVNNWQTFTGGPTNTSLSFGDGRHGIFNDTTMANFDSDLATANIIEINTDTYPDLQVTDFTLPNNITLRPVGSKPLIIRSLKSVTLVGNGTIDCSGENGQPTKQPETSTSSGGPGHCGGGRGGDGGRHTGVAFVAAETGYPQSGSDATGGVGGPNGTFGGGGGGSMYNNLLPTDGKNAAGGAGGGAAGSTHDDQDFGFFVGSAGGGGGGASVAGAGTDSTGSGGGAGGGIVRIYALQDFNNDGFVKANGGNGGAEAAGTLGGLGGGGGAGTVIVLAGGNYINNRASGIQAIEGSGGTRAANAGDGGNGGSGRGWYTDNDNSLGGVGGSENPACILLDCGTTQYDLGVLEATTLPIDLSNTRPTINSFNMTSAVGGGSTITVSVAGSKDNFQADDSGWLPIASVSSVNNKRYIKFKFSMNNQATSASTYIDDFTVNYSETTQDNFTFGVACGHITPPSDPTIFKFLFQLLAMMLPWFVIKIYHQLKPRITFGKT